MFESIDLEEILVNASRCSKVTKGGRKFSFFAIVVVGNKNGKVGYGLGKAIEVIDAKFKAIKKAKQKMFKIPLKDGRTLHHNVIGKFGASIVKIKTAPSGRGVIAGGPIRSVFQVLGVKDVVAKSLGSNNAHNVIRATINGLLKIQSPKMVSERRNKKVIQIINRKKY